MGVLKQTQFLFTKGEVGPFMEARADTNIYKAGLRTCENFLILPQGGLIRRPGFKFIDDHPNNVTLTLNAAKSLVAGETITQLTSGATGDVAFATTSSTTLVLQDVVGTFTTTVAHTLSGSTTGALSTYATAVPTTAVVDRGFDATSRLVPFNYGNEQEYVLVFEPNKVHIYKSDLHQATVVNGVSSDVCPWTTANISEFRFAQTLDTLIIVHEDFRPVTLVRGASHTAWTARSLDFDYIPLVNHNFDSDITVHAMASDAGSGSDEPNVMYDANVRLTIDGGTYQWVDADWPAGHRNMHIALNGGTAEIKTVGSSSIAYCDVKEELVNDDDVENDAWQVDAFSDLSATYGGGWPRSVSFHQNRLIFGGSRDNPQTIFGSQSGSFYNFKPTTKLVEIEKTVAGEAITTTEHITGEVTDDAGFSFTIASDEVSIIYHLVSTQQLYIFASSGEWLMEGSPVTPIAVSINRQTNYGIMNNGHKPVVVDTEAMFLSNNTELRAFAYNYNTDGYAAKNYTLISHHILSNPVDLCSVRSFSDTNSNYVFVVNDDGELAAMAINVEKDVLGWSRFTTDGLFKRCVEVDNALYVLVQRTIASTNRIYLEKMIDSDYYMDSYLAETTTPQSAVTLSHLASESVRVLTDSNLHANITLNSAGTGSLSEEFTNVAAGMHYESSIESLPATVIIANQYSQRGEQITKKRVDLILQNTQSLVFDGYDVTFESFNNTTTSSTPTNFSGTKLVYLSGTGVDLTITANVKDPLPATILGCTVEYKVPLTLEN